MFDFQKIFSIFAWSVVKKSQGPPKSISQMSIDKRQISPVPDTHPLSLRLQSSGWRQGICRVLSEVVKNVNISTNTILIRVLYRGGTMTTG